MASHQFRLFSSFRRNRDGTGGPGSVADSSLDPVGLVLADFVHSVVKVAAFGGVEQERGPPGHVEAKRLVALPVRALDSP